MTAEPMITAMSAVEKAAAHLRLIPKTTPNGGRRRVVDSSPRRMRAARSADGGDVLLARKSESAVSNSDAAARQSAQWARCDSKWARSEAVSSPS
jgi:hypothetical protein